MSIALDLELERLSSEAPALAGLTFRRLQLPDDAAQVAALHNRAAEEDATDELDSPEDWLQWLSHPAGFDPRADVVVGELGGRIVAYGQARWTDDNDGGRDYKLHGEVSPELRGRGLGRALVHHCERHLREIARTHDPTIEKRFESWSYESALDRVHLLESEGYVAVRYDFEMLRPTLDDIPVLPMPAGLELRPVRPDQHRQIWEADVEAFRDHWGGMDTSEGSFARRFTGPSFRPELWRVGWARDQVAGVVSGEIMTAYNEATGGRRGLVSGVSVRRPWRGRGLARALLADCLRALCDAGMTSAVLGVDGENPTGALRVYEAVGFGVARTGRHYRKPLVVEG